MFDSSEAGILYTEHSRVKAMAPGVASLWSFETRMRESGRRRIVHTRDGNCEYWLDRGDPLLNTILPGTGVSIIVNFGDLWAAGPSLATLEFLPRACVVGPVTRALVLNVGQSVCAMGLGHSSTLTSAVFGVPASDLVDRILPLVDVLPAREVERVSGHGIKRCLAELVNVVVARSSRPMRSDPVGLSAVPFIHQAGFVSMGEMARSHGLDRKQFACRFRAATGLPPKLFARITRFQALVHALLSTDVAEWASLSAAVGFYDQAHMINDFRAFAGSSPTAFFRPRCSEAAAAKIQLRGRPSEWSIPEARR